MPQTPPAPVPKTPPFSTFPARRQRGPVPAKPRPCSGLDPIVPPVPPKAPFQAEPLQALSPSSSSNSSSDSSQPPAALPVLTMNPKAWLLQSFPNMVPITADRLGRLMLKAGFNPTERIDLGGSSEGTWSKGGYFLKFKGDGLQRATWTSSDRWAREIFAIHGTTPQGAKGILEELQIRPHEALGGAGFFCIAAPDFDASDDAYKSWLAERMANFGRNLSGLYFASTAYLQWEAMDRGGHDDEAEILRSKWVATHHRPSGRWALPAGCTNLWGVFVEHGALESADVYLA